MKAKNTFEKHQENIALKTLKMTDAMSGVMGGMNKTEAINFLKSIGYTDMEIKKLSEAKTQIDSLIKEELSKILNETSYTDFILNYGQEIKDAVQNLKAIGKIHDKVDEKDYEQLVNKVFAQYDKNVHEFIDSQMMDPYADRIIRFALENYNRYGTEPQFVLLAIDDYRTALEKYVKSKGITTETKLREMIKEEINKIIKEWVDSGKELDILTNAAQDINREIFNNRGQYTASNYQLIIRDQADDVLKKLDKQTEIVKQVKGFNAKEDEAKQYYQLPKYNVAISFDKYGVSRGTIIQFLNFDGEYPVKKGMF